MESLRYLLRIGYGFLLICGLLLGGASRAVRATTQQIGSRAENEQTMTLLSEEDAMQIKLNYLELYGRLGCSSNGAQASSQGKRAHPATSLMLQGQGYRAVLMRFGLENRRQLSGDELSVVACTLEQSGRFLVFRKPTGLFILRPADPRIGQERDMQIDDQGHLVGMGVVPNARFGISMPLDSTESVNTGSRLDDGRASIAGLTEPSVRLMLLGPFDPAFCAPRRMPPLKMAFEEVQHDNLVFVAIVKYLGLQDKLSFAEREQQSVVHAYQQLKAIDLVPLSRGYQFLLNQPVGPMRGRRVLGIIEVDKMLEVLRKTPITLSCPK